LLTTIGALSGPLEPLASAGVTRPLPDRDALLGWYERVARPLPWRATRDPYALLVSEVMLQQTQAARVVPYYEAFLARFPTAAALAAAPVRDVLAAWSGLGYNRRALALHAAARVVAASGWPEDLTALPGVGAYTAAAVGSFAWDRDAAAVDTNARRVIERHDGEARRPRALAHRAAEWLPAGRAATFNQAMMELGATVCTPRAPRCGECPIASGCATHARGGPVEAPRRARGAARFEETDRWARGRIVAALVAGAPLPSLPRARFERAVAGLVRDGLVVLASDGSLRLP
jgi:A/G-specific adenine glycosylase